MILKNFIVINSVPILGYNEFSGRLLFKQGMFDYTDAWSIDTPLFYISEIKEIDKKEYERKIRGDNS